jgi:membrane fusion protein, copper/silver efflux system
MSGDFSFALDLKAIFMKKAVTSLLLIILLALSYLAGRHHAASNSSASVSARRVLYYVDPMHPAYKSDKPGIAPDCGMQLEPVYADEAVGTYARAAETNSLPAGVVKINLEQQQLIGIRVAEAAKASGVSRVAVPGRVVADETRAYKLTAGTEGVVLETFDRSVGSFVKRGEVLATFSSPELLTAEQTFLINWNRVAASKYEWASPTEWKDQTLRLAASQLRSLGMSEDQLKELIAKKVPADSIQIVAPVNGIIVARNITPGQRVDKGAEFYRIADLSRVWIMASFHEGELEGMRPGAEVTISQPNQRKQWGGRASSVLPQFDPATRTLQVRLETDNPGLVLRPDMFVNVEVEIHDPAGLTVPADALLDSGMSKHVYVDRGNGAFEPRQVETGWRSGDRIEIVRGLAPGERVVVSGTFLLDSESRLKSPQHAASSNAGGPATVSPAKSSNLVKDRSCGMEVDPAESVAAGNTETYQGKTYYFCSRSCRDKFHKDPQSLLSGNGSGHGKGTESAMREGRSPAND